MTREHALACPITIGTRNCEQMTGVSWRWVRDHAAELGVPVWRVGGQRGKSMIPAAQLLAALERIAEREPPPRERTDEEERVWTREQLGVVRKDGRR